MSGLEESIFINIVKIISLLVFIISRDAWPSSEAKRNDQAGTHGRAVKCNGTTRLEVDIDTPGLFGLFEGFKRDDIGKT